jgi:hypothetical protein
MLFPRVLVSVVVTLACCFAQYRTGEILISVADETGAALLASGSVVSQGTQTRISFDTNPQGSASVRNLPFGTYHLTVERPGFAPSVSVVEVQSTVPVRTNVILRVASVGTEIIIKESATLIDPRQTGSVFHIGSENIRERRLASPGRSLLELVDTQPGWVMEANGVLHPRGSEYDTQYVVDGLPVADNRSPAFAPELDADDVQSIHVLTANYPAEYGRKLGGVVEVQTLRDHRDGVHGMVAGNAASFATAGAYAAVQFGFGSDTVGVTANGTRTDRYLDPPVEDNYTNSGTTRGGSLRWEHDFRNADRLRAALSRRTSGFQVPNESIQEVAGQRQDRANQETAGQVMYQHVFTPALLGNIRARVRDVSATLWSNDLSTPIQPFQDRGFREGYAGAALAGTTGAHDWKAGADAIFASVREDFSYRITDRGSFDRGTARSFAFSDRANDHEQAAYVQDTVRLGSLTVSAGLRYDHYSFLVSDNALSPRLAAAWYMKRAGLVLRASYDRAFQTPAIENILLASSQQLEAVNDDILHLPVPPSRGNFYQVGFVKSIFDHLRLESNWFRRSIGQFSDDDVLLNTGVSFPIAFARADIHGVEAKLEIPRWGPVSAFISYANMTGTGQLPITGGLFLEEGAAELLRSNERFAITQDQRNTARARVRYQIAPRFWAALSASYGSGLPVELTSESPVTASPRILERVNFDRGRLRPMFSLDTSAGAQVWRHEAASLNLQADVSNITNRLNVINFAGLFSGTALAPPRNFGVRLRLEF